MLWLLIPLIMLSALVLVARLFPLPRGGAGRPDQARGDSLDSPEGRGR